VYSYSRASSRGTQPEELSRDNFSVEEDENVTNSKAEIQSAILNFYNLFESFTFFQQGRNLCCSLVEKS